MLQKSPQVAAKLTPHLWLLCLLTVAFGLVASINGIAGPMDRAPYEWPYAIFIASLFVLISSVIWSLPSEEGPAPQVGAPRGPDALLTLRAFACFLVVTGHYFVHVFAEPTGRIFKGGPLQLLASPPWAGVWVFFTLSGYLMGKSFFSGRYGMDEAGIQRFFKNRALRIMPVYVLAVTVVCAFQYPAIFQWQNLWMYLRILVFDFNSDFPIIPIGALWSVSTEVQFYLLAPFLAVLINRVDERWSLRGLAVPFMFMAVGFAIRAITYFVWGEFLYSSMMGQLDFFVSGMLLSKVLVRRGARPMIGGQARLPLGIFLIGAFYVGLTLAACRTIFAGTPMKEYFAYTAPLTGMFALTAITLFERANLNAVAGSFSMRFVKSTQTLGLMTYCIYVVHDPVFVTVRKMLPIQLVFVDNLWRLLWIFPIVGIASYVLYQFEKLFDRRRQAPVTVPAE